MTKRLIALSTAATLSALIVGITSVPALAQGRHATANLVGAGSTAVAPLFGIALQPQHESIANVTYDSIGSTGGEKALDGIQGGGPYDWGSFDVAQGVPGDPNYSDQSKIVQFPDSIFGEAVVTNLPGSIEKNLKLTGPILGQIFTGAISKWGAKPIEKLNPAIKKNKSVAHEKITPVVRSDGSGTSFIYTSYLCKVSMPFVHKWSVKGVCASKTPPWTSVFTSGKGNSGVDQVVSNTKGGIGYVETYYANQNAELAAFIQNKAKKFVRPTVADITADVKHGTPGNFSDVYPHFIIVNASGKNSYPIAGYTWSGLYQKGSEGQDPGNCAATVKLFKWFVSTKGGQRFAAPNGYVPLSSKPQSYANKQLAKVNCSA